MSKNQTLPNLPEITHHEKLPQGAQEVARIKMSNPKKLYVFIKYGNGLIIHSSRDAIIDGKPDYIYGQMDLPLGFLNWFPQALDDFRKPPAEGGLRAGAMVSDGELVEGEELCITREMGDQAWPEKGPPPGYEVKNRSRLRRGYEDSPAWIAFQKISFSEQFLFEGGLLSLIRRLGAQYRSGAL